MIYPEHMDRVAIVSPRTRSKELIELLYKHGVLHIVDHQKEQLDIGSPLPGSATLADLLVKARAVMHSLNVTKDNTQPTTVVGDLQEQIIEAHDEVTATLAKLKELQDELVRLRQEHKAYADLAWLHVDPHKLIDSKHLTYLFGTVKDHKDIQAALQTLTTQFYVETQKEGLGIFLLIQNEHAHAARQLLGERGFIAADHARIVALDVPLTKKLGELTEKISQTNKAIHEKEVRLRKLAHEYGSFLIAAEQILSVDAKKSQTPLRFGVTKNALFVNGWVPATHTAQLKRDLETQLGNEVVVHTMHTHEEAPIKLNNNFAVSPYEALLRLYTLPKYHEIDPSTMLFFSFPIFFGFMLGDIGYGLVLLALFMILRATLRNSKELAALASIFIMSAVSTVIFGIVFGEFFGAEHIGHLELHPLLHRAHDMDTLLYVSIAVGVIHITIALLIGFVNELHHKHSIWKAFCAKISWLFFLAGLALIGVGVTMHKPTVIPGAVLTVVSIILIYLGEGVRGLVELPGILSNIMSYARLMALGVASAALAIVINELAGDLFSLGTVGIIGGILVLIVGHLINFVLGIIGPFLHSLRLHYVEFFSKFYEGGGKPYKPFGVDDA